jgi:hypothetical protein
MIPFVRIPSEHFLLWYGAGILFRLYFLVVVQGWCQSFSSQRSVCYPGNRSEPVIPSARSVPVVGV